MYLSSAKKFNFSFFQFHISGLKFQISDLKFWSVMCMKNNGLDREFDKLVEGRMKKLSKINLKEEMDITQYVSILQDRDGDEVFWE